MSIVRNLLNNKTAVNGSLFTLFAFVNHGVSFVLLIILAQYIAPGEYGQLNLFNTFIQLFSIIICLGTSGFITVSFFKKEKIKLNKIINSVFLIATGVLFLLLFVLSFFSSSFEKWVGIDVKYQWIALFICYCQVYNNINLKSYYP